MPYRTYFYRANEFDGVILIGTVLCSEAEAFEVRIDSLCKAMEWNRKGIEHYGGYLGAVRNSLMSL